jgi:hypothetical protein
LNTKFPQLCILEEDIVHGGNGNYEAGDAIGKSAFQNVVPEKAEKGTGYQGSKMKPAALIHKILGENAGIMVGLLYLVRKIRKRGVQITTLEMSYSSRYVNLGMKPPLPLASVSPV